MKLMARDKFDNDGIDIEKQSQGGNMREKFRVDWVICTS